MLSVAYYIFNFISCITDKITNNVVNSTKNRLGITTIT